MKEYMFFIRKPNKDKVSSPEQHQHFLKACETYIARLKQEGRLLAAQPIERSGNIISKPNGIWKSVPYSENEEIIGGYYHILAKNLEEAISIAKANPEFDYNLDARIEVRLIKGKEESTGFVYPTS